MFAFNISAPSNITDLLAKKAELEALLKKTDEDLNVDRHYFIAQVHQLIDAFSITKEEAFPPKKKESKAPVDKYFSPDYFYRDPKTGEEWDGKGKKRPAFLFNKRNTEEFRIYHATGTKSQPVVKPVAVLPVTASSSVSTPPVATPTLTSVVMAAQVAHLPSVALAVHHPATAFVPTTADYSASALQTNVDAEAAAITS